MRSSAARRERPHDPANDDRLQNIVAVKHYFFDANATNLLGHAGSMADVDASGHRMGVGDGLRLRLRR
jgi:hypothetical protein